MSTLPDTALDPLGHHAVTCRHGGNVVMHHNRLQDALVDFSISHYITLD